MVKIKNQKSKIQWPSPPAQLQLADDEVHIWAASLEVTPDILSNLSATLSSYEQERAGKFKFPQLQNRFRAGRSILRRILGGYLQTDPANFDFIFSPKGKPSLAEPHGTSGIHFNLAHSGDLALFAVTRIGPVGVDVEIIRPVKDATELVARFFSLHESASFQKVPENEKPTAFFHLWSRKEAMLKATGEGIGASLSAVEVSFLPGEPARVLAISGDSEKAKEWTLQELSPASDFIGTMAIQQRHVKTNCWRFEINHG